MRFLIWQSKYTVKISVLLLIFKSSTSYIGNDLRDVREECQRIKSCWEALNQGRCVIAWYG